MFVDPGLQSAPAERRAASRGDLAPPAPNITAPIGGTNLTHEVHRHIHDESNSVRIFAVSPRGCAAPATFRIFRNRIANQRSADVGISGNFRRCGLLVLVIEKVCRIKALGISGGFRHFRQWFSAQHGFADWRP
jgi:hypothetical protein